MPKKPLTNYVKKIKSPLPKYDLRWVPNEYDHIWLYHKEPLSPERMLLIAILERALRDLSRRELEIRRDAILWFKGVYDNERDGISWEFVKEHLELSTGIMKIIDSRVAEYDR